MRIGRLPLLLLFLSILLGACSRPTLKRENVVFGETKLLENWRLEGRIGIQLPNESWQSSIHWNQHGGDFKISLYSPFGRVLGRVQKQAEDILLVDSDGQTHHRSTRELDYLVNEQLGLPIPISSLRYWVLGQPQPNRSWQPLDSSKGQAQGFSQAGWDIRFDRWALFDGQMLPVRLTLRHDAIKMRLVLHEWVTTPMKL